VDFLKSFGVLKIMDIAVCTLAIFQNIVQPYVWMVMRAVVEAYIGYYGLFSFLKLCFGIPPALIKFLEL